MDLLQSSADFVGVDLGTSSCKVAVVDLHGGIKATSAKRYTIEVGESGMAEQDPEKWWAAVSEALRDVFSSGLEFDVKGVGVTGQWSGTVPVDSEGNPLHKAIIWMDTRGKDVVKRLTGWLSFDFWLQDRQAIHMAQEDRGSTGTLRKGFTRPHTVHQTQPS